MSVYYDIFKAHDDLPYGDDNPADSEIVYAGYTYEDYSGSAIVVFRRDAKWYENHDGHCSCYGLENWKPEETSSEAILMRPDGWPGLREAVEAALAADAVDPHAADQGTPSTRAVKSSSSTDCPSAGPTQET